MKYDISKVIETYPDVHIGVLIGQNMDNKRQILELYQLQKEAIKHTKKQIGVQPPTKHPHIASWRQLYRSFGTKPGDYRPSAEALIRRCIKTGKLPRINNAVDLYNIVSIRHIIPMGGFDLDKIDSNIYLRFSTGDENFIPLGIGNPEKTYPGEVVYADESNILTRRWNYRDANHTKITNETRNLVMFIDATSEISPAKVREALDALKMLYEKYCDGIYITTIANKENPTVDLR